MPKIKHNITPVDPIGLEEFSDDDIKVVGSFDINTTFDAFQHKIELHVYTEDNQLIDSYYDYRNEKFLQGSQTAGTTGASELTLDPKEDAERLGYTYGGINFVYNFLDNLYSETGRGGELFIEEISEDRTEIRLLTNQIEEDALIKYTEKIKDDIKSTSYFNDFRLNVKNNDLLIGINIDIQDYRDYKSVIVKLYEPLPSEYSLKELLTVERIISDTVAFKVDTVITPDEIHVPYLKGPNFNIDEAEEQNSPTGFLNYNDLFSFPTNNTYREVHSRLNEKGVDISVRYNDFSNFTQFSSVEERVRNFQYKLNLIETYQSQSDVVSNITGAATGSRFLTGSSVFYENKINTILDNFDHYDRHLYYESGSTSWPKQAPSNKPYIQATGSATGSFFTELLLSASNFDQTNENQLLNTIPEYLREDPDSINYSTFINMLGQHFDNIWVYAKALSDKYDNDNRLEYGISKDLVQDTLRNFGVKIYNNFRSTEDLFKTFTGQLYASESIHQTVISASNEIVSLEDYRKDISKRIYHNLPHLLKTKGTERGLKALIASFGVPTNSNLDITNSDTYSIPGLCVRTIGGKLTSGSTNFGPSTETTSSVAKIKVDNTGSIVDGNTLSQYASIVERDKKYSDDIHTVEVGFSPTYLLNEKIVSASGLTYNIDDYIGNPKDAYSSSYATLVSHSKAIIAPEVIESSSYNAVGDGFRVSQVTQLNVGNAFFGYTTAFIMSGSPGPTGSSYIYSTDRISNTVDADIPTGSNHANRYMKKQGGGFVEIVSSSRYQTVFNLTSGTINGTLASSGSNIINIHLDSGSFAGAVNFMAGANIYLSQSVADGQHTASIDGQVINKVYQYGQWWPPGSLSFSDAGQTASGSQVKAIEVSGGPYSFAAGTKFQTTMQQIVIEHPEKIDTTIHTVSGSQSGTLGNWFAYELSETTTGNGILSTPYKSHHYGEFVRSLKFYDNVLFKMIKDFVPARSNINSGIIIKPHLLERNKLKQVKGSFTNNIYTGSIDTNDTTGSSGGSFLDNLGHELKTPLTASYTHSVVIPGGTANYTYHLKERARYDGELSGSRIKLLSRDGDLNDANEWKYKNISTVSYMGELVELVTCPTIDSLTTSGSKILAFTGSANINHVNNNLSGGFVYGTSFNPTIADTTVYVSNAVGPYTSSALLVPAVGTYYVRGFVSSSNCGIAYTSQSSVTFTCPSVSSPVLSNISSQSMNVAANMLSAGTGDLRARGFIYGTASAGVTSMYSGDYQFITSSSLASNTLEGFTATLSGLDSSSTYYVRSFLSSSICVDYGDSIVTVSTSGSAASGSFMSFGGSEIERAPKVCPTEEGIDLMLEETYYFEDDSIPERVYPAIGDEVFLQDLGGNSPGDPAIAIGGREYIKIGVQLDDNGENFGQAGSDNNLIRVNGLGRVVGYFNCSDL